MTFKDPFQPQLSHDSMTFLTLGAHILCCTKQLEEPCRHLGLVLWPWSQKTPFGKGTGGGAPLKNLFGCTSIPRGCSTRSGPAPSAWQTDPGCSALRPSPLGHGRIASPQNYHYYDFRGRNRGLPAPPATGDSRDTAVGWRGARTRRGDPAAPARPRRCRCWEM